MIGPIPSFPDVRYTPLSVGARINVSWVPPRGDQAGVACLSSCITLLNIYGLMHGKTSLKTSSSKDHICVTRTVQCKAASYSEATLIGNQCPCLSLPNPLQREHIAARIPDGDLYVHQCREEQCRLNT